MEKYAPGAIVRSINQCALHIGADMVCAVEKVQNTLGQQVFILPLSVHVAVKADIACKYDGSLGLIHHLLSFS